MSELKQEIKALLFGDVVAYSSLTDQAISVFVERFLGGIAHILQQREPLPLFQNTWGDALYAAFDDVGNAGETALALRDWIRNEDWARHGLPRDLTMRFGLHAGPVFVAHDPVIDGPAFMGNHTTRAARIEQSGKEGRIYVSEEFAALAAAEGITTFRCEYAGLDPRNKDIVEHPLYLLERS